MAVNGEMDEKALKKALEMMEKINKESSLIRETWSSISAELFGISGAGLFKEIPKTAEEIKEGFRQLKELTDQIRDTQSDFLQEAQPGFEQLKQTILGITNDIDFSKINFAELNIEESNKFLGILNEQGLEFLDSVESTEEKYRIIRDLLKEDVSFLLKDNNADILEAVLNMQEFSGATGDGADKLREVKSALNGLVESQKELKNEVEKTTKEQNGLLTFFEKFSEKLRGDAIKGMFEFDQILNDAQKNSGILVEKLGAVENMEFAMQASKFNVSMSDAYGLVQKIGDELNTTNLETVGIANNFLMIEKATGLASENTANIVGELMRGGKSAEDISEYFAYANTTSKLMGVNSRKVLESLSKNLDKMRTFGFVEGEKSMARMVTKSEQLRMNVDELLKMTDAASSIEGAIDMASQLQLAAGSFSNIDPMSLLAAARKGPEEMQKILTQMGSDIGSFNENGEFKFDPIDRDRLRIVSEATGQSMESLTEMIRNNAIAIRKTGIIPDSVFADATKNMDNLDAQMARSSLADMLDKDGNIKEEFKVYFDQAGIKNIENASSEQLKQLFDIRQKEAKDLETQAKENQSLKDSVNAFMGSVTNLLTVFQPVLNQLTAFVSSFQDSSTFTKAIVGGAILAAPLIGKSLSTGIGNVLGQKIGSLFGMGKVASATGSMAVASQNANKIDLKGIGKFSLALGMVGLAVAGFAGAIAAVGGEASLEQLGTAAASLVILGIGMYGYSQIAGEIDLKSVGIGTLAALGISASIAAFGIASKYMEGVNWGAVLSGLGVMALAFAGIMGIGALLTGTGGVVAIAMGAGALAVIGLAATFAIAGKLFESGSNGFMKLQDIDWNQISSIGPALLSASPGLFAFSASMFALGNPISLIGMRLALSQLSSFSDIVTPLSENLVKAANAMAKFAEEMSNIGAKIEELNIEKLEKFQDVSSNLSEISLSSAITGAISKIGGLMTGSGEQQKDKSYMRELKLIVYLPDGRELKSKIIEDNEYLS